MNPSQALRQQFKKDCQDQCMKFRWIGKAAFYQHDRCVSMCVRQTIERERPHVFKERRKGNGEKEFGS
jgi:hypothetical protein